MPYDIVTHVGPPSNPIPFDNISYGNIFTVRDMLFQKCSSLSSTASKIPRKATTRYWTIPEKEEKRTIWGYIWFYYVLRRDPDGDGAALTLIFEIVALKTFDWSNVRANQYMHESPVIEIVAIQFLGNIHPNVLYFHEVLLDAKCLNDALDYYNGGNLHNRLYQVNLNKGGNVRVGFPEDEARY